MSSAPRDKTGDRPEVDDIIAAMEQTAPVPQSFRRLIGYGVGQMQVSGVWDILDAFYWFGAHNEDAALINWKQPGVYGCTKDDLLGGTTAPTFLTFDGFQSAVASVLNTNFNPNSASSPEYSLNSAWVGAYITFNAGVGGGGYGSGPIIGLDADNSLRFTPNGTNFVTRANNTTDDSNANVNQDGLFQLNRKSSSQYDVVRNGSIIATVSRSSVSVPNGSILFLGNKPTSTGTLGKIRAGWIASKAGSGTGSPSTSHIALMDSLVRGGMSTILTNECQVGVI